MTLLQKTIADLVAQHGSLRALACALGCDYSYLSRLRTGNKKVPSDAMLKKMKLRRVVSFERTDLVSAATAPQPAAQTVHQAANELIAHIGYHGEIDSRHPLTHALINALGDADVVAQHSTEKNNP